jgi:limonene-1,2-epoxide hydrolase
MSNIETVKAFCQAWSRRDASELADDFTDDGVYYNMPIQPVAGKDNVKVFIENFLATWTDADWDILNVAEAGDVVFCERVDQTKTTMGDVDLPCVGVFEMQDGKIKVWRDYFDMNTFTSAMSAK